MAITDLTNTKWIFNTTITATAGYGAFSVKGVISDSAKSEEFRYFNVGYRYDVGHYVRKTQSNVVYLTYYGDNNVQTRGIIFQDTEDGVNFYSSITGKTITFTGGNGVTNSSFISWLIANATQIVEEEEKPSSNKYEILYNDEIIGVVAPGEKIVIHCAGDIMEYNLVVRHEPEPEPSGFTVELLNLGIATVSIYEGTSTSGKYLGDYNYNGTIITSSEYLHLVPIDWVAYNDYVNVTGGVSVYADGGSEYLTLKITGDGTLSCYFGCLIEGTPITLSNNSTKAIEEITYEDDLLVWDFDNGCFASAKPIWIQQERKAIEYNHLVFSDGSELNTVNQHRIFNVEKGVFTYPMTDDTPIGTTTFNDKGEFVTLVSKEVIEKEVDYYNVITDYHINLFAGSILTSCRLSNIYPIENMKYVKDNRDIIDYEEFNNIPIEYYYGLRLGEQPTDINRDGAVSFGDTSVEDYVKRLLANKKE